MGIMSNLFGFYLWSTTSKYGEVGNLPEIHPDLWNLIKLEIIEN